ncbi:MAG TPA: hypothetical protein ENG05_02135 [Acidilobales archaeon]|nr:hypothetical protein [Acidilobales archaeon]
MTFFWEPRWVRKKIIYEGIEIYTCQDMVTKMYICPICSDIDKVCPEGRTSSIVSEDMVTFFTIEDLINHLRTHGLDIEAKKIKAKVSEE